jgi:hypothetical protein
MSRWGEAHRTDASAAELTPSEESWRRGARRLAIAPELASDIAEVSALGRQVSDLALEATHGGPRGEIYGSILATCSTCHRRLAIEPEAPISSSAAPPTK